MVKDTEYKNLIWSNFCERFQIHKVGVELFDCNQTKTAKTFNYGNKRVRLLLRRSVAMEKLLISEVNKVFLDFNNKSNIYDGLQMILELAEKIKFGITV